MHYRLTACSLAVAAAFASASAFAAPTVAFKQPTSGKTVSGTISGSACEATGSNIRQVRFYVDNKWVSTDTSSAWNCSIDTTKYGNGTHYLRAVAYDAAGVSKSYVVGVNVQNGGSTPPPPPPTPTPTGPSVSWTAPASGGTMKGNIQQSTGQCQVSGTGIARVVFSMDATPLNTELTAPYLCNVDTTKFANGSHTLKAVAYNSAGASTTISRSVTIQNATTVNTPPSVALISPAAGATLSNDATCAASASDTGGSIAKVDFMVDNKLVASDSTAPYACSFNTLALTNGSHTLMAVAIDNTGLRTSTQRSVTVSNTTTPPDDPVPGTGIIDAADIVNQAQASVPFAQQSGYNTQVISTYLSANQIPESGIHHSVLPNGESLRLGKQTDPRDSSRKALAFQLAPGDPPTSGSRRAEIKFPENIQNDKVYWVAFSHYVEDWGTFPTSDTAIVAFQLHGGNVAGLSPAIGMYSRGGRSFWIDARGSTAASPSQSTSVSVKSTERPLQFGRWVTFVTKFKLNTSGKGYVQVWMDGTQIFNHQGTVGYNTGSVRPYFKFGYYNWTSFSSPRKVLLRSPVIVADPTGSKYTPDALRQFVQSK